MKNNRINNKKKICILGIICLIVIILICIAVTTKKMNKNTDTASSISQEAEETEQNSDADTTEKTELSEEESDEDTDTNASSDQNNRDQGTWDEEAVIQHQEEVAKEIPAETITFPYTIPNTEVVITDIRSMDGVFLEDGSDVELSDMCTILLENNGENDIEYISIKLNRDGRAMEFAISDIPAGASAVSYEQNRSTYAEGTYQGCKADIAWIDELAISEEIKVTENEDGSLKVENLTNKDIPCVRIFYKYYMEEEDIYVGGITYNAKINDLKAKSSVNISPKHYAAGYSKVVMARTYQEEQ